jgi:hypothetical protein
VLQWRQVHTLEQRPVRLEGTTTYMMVHGGVCRETNEAWIRGDVQPRTRYWHTRMAMAVLPLPRRPVMLMSRADCAADVMFITTCTSATLCAQSGG